MICPACGARNSERAGWCTQCYTVLDRADDDRAGDDGGCVDGDEDDHGPGDDRDVRVRDDQVEWRCGACGTWSTLLDPVCRGCGSPRAGFTPEDHRAERTPRAGPATSLAATVLVPGFGHLLRGMTGLGSAVLLLWLLWFGGALLSRGGAVPLTAVLTLAALTLWAGSLADLSQRLDDRAPVLSGRVLAWSTVAVTVLLVVVAIGGGLGAGG